MPQYNEQWIVTVNRKEIILNAAEKEKLEYAMRNGDRWFKLESGDILSVSHIESVILHSREVANKLPEGEKQDNFQPISDEKLASIKKEIYQKVGKVIK